MVELRTTYRCTGSDVNQQVEICSNRPFLVQCRTEAL